MPGGVAVVESLQLSAHFLPLGAVSMHAVLSPPPSENPLSGSQTFKETALSVEGEGYNRRGHLVLAHVLS